MECLAQGPFERAQHVLCCFFIALNGRVLPAIVQCLEKDDLGTVEWKIFQNNFLVFGF